MAEMFTKKHFEKFAEVLAVVRFYEKHGMVRSVTEAIDAIERGMVNEFEVNPRFDSQRFLNASHRDPNNACQLPPI